MSRAARPAAVSKATAAAKRAAAKKPLPKTLSAARKSAPAIKAMDSRKPDLQDSTATKPPNTGARVHANAAAPPRRASSFVGKHPSLVVQPAPGRPRHLTMADIAAGVRLMKIGR